MYFTFSTTAYNLRGTNIYIYIYIYIYIFFFLGLKEYMRRWKIGLKWYVDPQVWGHVTCEVGSLTRALENEEKHETFSWIIGYANVLIQRCFFVIWVPWMLGKRTWAFGPFSCHWLLGLEECHQAPFHDQL